MSDSPKIEVISLKESPRIRSNFVRELFPDMISIKPFETPSLDLDDQCLNQSLKTLVYLFDSLSVEKKRLTHEVIELAKKETIVHLEQDTHSFR
jgi:hypothetical protein